jgi:hypothetical protein
VRSIVAASAVLLTAVLVGAGPALAAPSDFVKYYVVASSYQGAPENLAEIAGRFLGTSGRSREILDLNAGRRQPDGGSVTAAGRLHAGWALVLPWDAVGSGVHYGALPATMPPATTPPKPSSAATPTPTASDRGHCTAPPGPSATSDWAANRVDAASAWTRTRGQGVLVAVVDSGVDGAAGHLGDHLAPGADIVTGSGTGEVDCLGSGTAMAEIVAGHPASDAASVAVAPDASVTPVRVVATTAAARPADVAAGIQVATSAGAGVIVVGSLDEPDDPAVTTAIASATLHDVVVVIGASAHPSAAGVPESAVLRVGAVDSDNHTLVRYPAGAVDVVAPGVNVAVLSRSRTGSQYAAAFVAGEVALVRSADPALNAVEVAHRVVATTDPAPTGTGAGMINPGHAVDQALPEETHPVTAPAATTASATGSGHLVLILASALVLVTAVVLLLRLPRVRGRGAGAEERRAERRRAVESVRR